MYVPLQVHRFHESILLIVQYRYLKSCSRDFYSPESDPPHKIMRYCVYDSIWLDFSFFSPDHAGLVEMICTTVVPVSKGHLGGPALGCFYMIHRGGRVCMYDICVCGYVCMIMCMMGMRYLVYDVYDLYVSYMYSHAWVHSYICIYTDRQEAAQASLVYMCVY